MSAPFPTRNVDKKRGREGEQTATSSSSSFSATANQTDKSSSAPSHAAFRVRPDVNAIAAPIAAAKYHHPPASARNSAASSSTTSSVRSSHTSTRGGGGVFSRLNSATMGTAASSRVLPHKSSNTTTAMTTAASSTTKSGTGTATAAPAAVQDPVEALWAVKRQALEEERRLLAVTHQQLRSEKEEVLDAVEGMLQDHETVKVAMMAAQASTAAEHASRMRAIMAEEDACLARKQRALGKVEHLQARVQELTALKEGTQEAIVLESDRAEQLQQDVQAAQQAVAAAEVHLAALLVEEERMKDTAYGLTGEVKDMVLEMEQLQAARRKAEVAAMETEITRRELYSTCEELKGSIRVYCRVKGSKRAPPPLVCEGEEEEEALAAASSSTSSPQTTSLDFYPDTLPAHSQTGRTEGEEDWEESAPPTPASSVFSVSPSRARRLASNGFHPQSARTDRTKRSLASFRAAGAAAAGASSSRHQYPTSSSTRASEAGSTVTSLFPDANGAEEGVEDFFSFPDRSGNTNSKNGIHGKNGEGAAVADEELVDEFTVPRTITVRQQRQNATSTGRQSTSECFTFDHVFDHKASQPDVYREVEPLVNSAIDGYRVCVFAYGQTGSGKTYTMEGAMPTGKANKQPQPANETTGGARTEVGNSNDDGNEEVGIIPRALETIFARQEQLAKEGWSYTLTCSLLEIYNDVVRDLQQNPSIYEGNGGGASSSSSFSSAASPSSNAYHTIKHQGENTTVTNVKATKLASMADFRKVYRTATQNRRTARTQLNERSSRSHCIFTLHIDGVNHTIRQKSAGVLCLVDLAGSERVNDSGVQGQQFKEAVNINKSLLDLGKCIHALRGGTVAPWRNCKLTYLLQNYLGAKGGKMLMLVNISDRRQHLPESVNSLRFATRVSETVVGASVKRVTNF